MIAGSKSRGKVNIEVDDFERFFQKVNNPEGTFHIPDEDINDFLDSVIVDNLELLCGELNCDISAEEVSFAIGQLKAGKSAEPDLILNEFLVHGESILLLYFVNLFNAIFSSGIFPKSWTAGIIVPLHKKGSVKMVENYRGITGVEIN